MVPQVPWELLSWEQSLDALGLCWEGAPELGRGGGGGGMWNGPRCYKSLECFVVSGKRAPNTSLLSLHNISLEFLLKSSLFPKQTEGIGGVGNE